MEVDMVISAEIVFEKYGLHSPSSADTPAWIASNSTNITTCAKVRMYALARLFDTHSSI